MKTRNTNTYRATFNGLIGTAFGLAHVFEWTPEIEIYQARVSPELWRARPSSGRAGKPWEASTAVDLMGKINASFIGMVKPWSEWTRTGACVNRDVFGVAAGGEKRRA